VGIVSWLLIALAAAVGVLGAAEIVLRRLALKLRPLSEWRNWEMQHKVDALTDLAREGGASIVAVGSSTMNAAVDPDLLSQLTDRNCPAFNAALNGAGMRLLELWTLRIIVPRLRPDIVVIGLGSGEINRGNIVAKRLLRSFLTSPAWGELTGEGSAAVRWIHGLEERSFLVRYRRYLGRRSLFQPDPFERASACRRLGLLRWFLIFRYRPYVIEDRQVKIWKEALNEYEIGPEDLAALDRLIDGLRAAGVVPLLVKTPSTADWVGFHPGGEKDFKSFEDAVDSVVRRREVPFADLMAPLSSIEEYADPVHVNGAGQERFTGLLADVIAQLPTPSRT
jgi:hypothetical protein